MRTECLVHWEDTLTRRHWDAAALRCFLNYIDPAWLPVFTPQPQLIMQMRSMMCSTQRQLHVGLQGEVSSYLTSDWAFSRECLFFCVCVYVCDDKSHHFKFLSKIAHSKYITLFLPEANASFVFLLIENAIWFFTKPLMSNPTIMLTVIVH